MEIGQSANWVGVRASISPDERAPPPPPLCRIHTYSHCLTTEVVLTLGLDLPSVIVTRMKTKAPIGLILLYGVDLKNHWISIRILSLIL